MVYRNIILLILSMYPFVLNGTSDDNNPSATKTGNSGFPQLPGSSVQHPVSPTPEDQEDKPKEIALSESQVETVKQVQALLHKKDRTILIKSVAIMVVGGMTMLAIGRLK